MQFCLSFSCSELFSGTFFSLYNKWLRDLGWSPPAHLCSLIFSSLRTSMWLSPPVSLYLSFLVTPLLFPPILSFSFCISTSLSLSLTSQELDLCYWIWLECSCLFVVWWSPLLNLIRMFMPFRCLVIPTPLSGLGLNIIPQGSLLTCGIIHCNKQTRQWAWFRYVHSKVRYFFLPHWPSSFKTV